MGVGLPSTPNTERRFGETASELVQESDLGAPVCTKVSKACYAL